jgi:adenylosuccinate synthase
VVVRYAHTLNAFTSLNLTKLDVLDDLDEVKIAVAYTLDGERLPIGSYPSTLEDLSRVQVVYETLPGWKTSTRGVRRFRALPPAAQAYVQRLEAVTGCPIAWVGTGPGRHEMIPRGFTHEG